MPETTDDPPERARARPEAHAQQAAARIAFEAAMTPLTRADATPSPASISHYTDAAGIIGIVNGRSLWATDTLFMNDPGEQHGAVLHFLNEVEQTAARAYSALRQRLSSAGKAVGRIPAHSGNRLADEFGRSFGRDDGTYAFDPKVYAICFCEEGDLLSQWRGYADFGGGYSLQLDADAIRTATTAVVQLSLVRVLYDTDRARVLAREIMEAGFAALERLIVDFQTVTPDRLIDITARATARAARMLSLRVKDAAFREEREWRLVYVHEPFSDDTNLQREFRPTSRGITPFVSIPTALGRPPAFDRDAHSVHRPGLRQLPLVGVTVGPTADPETALRATGFLLRDARIDATVRRSKIQLRQ